MKQALLKLRRSAPAGIVLTALAAIMIAGLQPARADDRDLVRTSSSQPYVFILFDSTGSMWRVPESNADANDFDDDPGSRMFQAKSSLYAVLEATEGVNFGFATFPNQDDLYVGDIQCGGDCVCRDDTPSQCDDYGGGDIQDVNDPVGMHCGGWEPNDDDNDDEFDNYTFNLPTTTNASGLRTGDVLPLDWNDDNKLRIQRRLAPNLALPGETIPDFGLADYFAPRQSGENFHRLDNGIESVFMAYGLTPLEAAMRDFQDWYEDWEDDARANDPDFDCKQVFVLLLTDGFETCNGDATLPAAELRTDEGILTYVIGFATDNPDLNDIAAAGGTNEAFFAENQNELVEDLTEILTQIQGKARTFASATVPSVIGSAGKQIFHTSFNPANGQSVWPGRIDSYIRPVPLFTIEGSDPVVKIPDYTVQCTGSVTEGCQEWDAGDAMLNQAPTPDEIIDDTLRIGRGQRARRLFYRRADNGNRRLLRPPGGNAAKRDLYGPTGFGFPDGDSAEDVADGIEVIERTLVQKTTTVLNPFTDTEQPKTYILGDIFHSDPTVVGSPANFRYFSSDLEGRIEACGPRVDGTTDDHLPYPCFLEQHQYRRRVLLVGSNDGQLHAFDAGRASTVNGEVVFGNGTGKEVWSYLPRMVMPKVRELADNGGHEFTVDGPVTVDDVLIDGEEWRTVAVGGLREGGSGYYALDITQPDEQSAPGEAPTSDNYTPSCFNSLAPDDDDNLVPNPNCAIQHDITALPDFTPRNYPTVLWEFTDTSDEDGNGAPDLGDSWSRPNTGRIKVCDSGCGTDDEVLVDRYVAIFGGGLDAAFKTDPVIEGNDENSTDDDFYRPWSGNFLYIVDIPTGDILYKRKLDRMESLAIGGTETPAMAPSEPAAVDLDQNSYIDTIYIGTTDGYVHKVDLSEPQEIDSTTGRVLAEAWDPIRIFDTGGRPIYYPPSVVFVSQLGQFALAFGTGDREDLWALNGQEGRFYTFLDTGFTADTEDLPFNESELEPIDPVETVTPAGSDFLLAPNTEGGKRPGWVMTFDSDERVIDRAFSLAGVLFFTTFNPDISVQTPGQCGSTGSSSLFTLFINNATAVQGERFRTVADLVTRPYVEPSINSDQPPSNPAQPSADDEVCDSSEMASVTETLKNNLFPQECEFANYTLNVMTIRSESGLECVAPVPICVIQRNWKEF